jgi:two-component system, cell cycle sensor histidine kinase and response regulator CckA
VDDDATSHKQLEAELQAMTWLHRIGALFLSESGSVEPVLAEIVDAAIAICGADFGNIQLIDPMASRLEIAAQRGFPQWWLDFWDGPSGSNGACNVALERRDRVIVEDVEHSPIFLGTPALEVQRKAGVRAVVCTPIVGRSGNPLGMFSIHYRAPQRPHERALRLLDLLTQQAADILERWHSERDLERRVEERTRQLSLSAEALRDSEAKYRRIVEATHEGVITSDPEGRFTFVNRRFARMVGYDDPSELIGKSALELMDEESRALARANIDRRRQGTAGTGEFRFKRRDGGDLWVTFASSPILDDVGTVIGVLGVLDDVTERRLAEGRLREQTKLYETFLRAQGDFGHGVSIIEGDRFVFVNDALAQMYGYTVDELLALPSFLALVPPEEQPPIIERRRTGRDQPEERRETTVMHKTGRRIQIEYSTKMLGPSTRLLSIIRDVTEKKRSEARLLGADRMAAVGTLAAGVAHEINNPLTYVSGNLERIVECARELSARTPALDEVVQLASEACLGAERIRKIVRGLKVFSRGEDEHRIGLDVCKVLDSAIDLTQNEIRHRARLVKDFAPLPIVVADEARLAQVFVNLLINAAQALPIGEVRDHEIRVITSTDSEGRATIEVRDTGPGIPPDIVNRIFEPFFTTKDVGIGTGLGLSICHGIVTSLGGTISVRSEPGQPTSFRIVLPPGQPVSTQPPARPASVLPSRRGRVLIVDDDALVATAIRRTLRDHEVTVVANGRDALSLLDTSPVFDLILCDLMMPEVSGMDVYAQVSTTRPELVDRIVFVTGGAFTPAARNFLDEVPNEFVEKPLDTRNLRALVQRFVR